MSKQPDVYQDDDPEPDSRDLARQAQIELPYGTTAFRKLVERYKGQGPGTDRTGESGVRSRPVLSGRRDPFRPVGQSPGPERWMKRAC